MSEEKAATRRLGLPDLCAHFFTFAFQLGKTQDPGPAEQLYANVNRLLSELDASARQHDIALEAVQNVKYALCAFFDELVLTSQWPAKHQWSGRPLQLVYFNDFAAGEEFYNRLEQLRHTQDRIKLDMLEVYYLCLALGFKGKFADLQGMEKRKVLMDSVARELRAARGEEADSLSVSWKPPDSLPRVARGMPAWVVPVFAAGILLVIYVVFSFILSSSAGGAEDLVN